jgi:predicted Fe-Mo cluster-binding NifX family protein
MKVAVSIEEGKGLSAAVCPTFGRAPWFVVIDDDTDGMTFLVNAAAAGAQGAGAGAAALLVQHDVQAVISGRFGPTAYEALRSAGIRMFVSIAENSAETALQRFRSGSLKEVAAG